MLAEGDELQSEAAGVRAQPTGTMRVDALPTYGRLYVTPRFAARAALERLGDRQR